MKHLNPSSDFLAAIAATGALAGWQENLDWALRVVASLIAITAGSIALYKQLRKKKRVEV